MAEDYVLQTKITADSTSFDKGIKSAQNSLKGLSSSISSAIKLAGGLFAIGSIAQLGKALSDMSQSYAKATQNIVRGTGAVGEQLKTLQKSVNASLINGVGRDASELGEMVADLNTRLGVTGDTLTELVSQFDDFSNVTGTDTKTAINSVSDVLAKWNIETSQTVPLLDQLTYASQASGASVIELTNGLKSGQAVFSQFGMSATESIAFLGTLKKNGIETSSAIMGMKTALANFAKSGLDAKTAFAEISESIKNAGSQTEALSIATKVFGQRNGAEFVRVLSGGTEGVDAFTEALENAGGSLARTNEASRTSADAMRDLKATIAGVFSTSGTDNGLRDLIDDIARAIRNLDFTSIKETFSNIGLFIKGVWEQVKELFNNLSGAIDITGGNFKIFADIIYQNLNNAYKVLQDFVGMVSAVLSGDWSVAWEYAKLIVLRTVKQMEESINNAIKLMPNLFNSVVEGYNWVLEQQDKLFLDIFHLPEKYFKSAKLPKYEGKDLIDTKSIEEAIEKVRKTIESKTGKIADKNLSDLKKQKEAVHYMTESIKSDIGSLGNAVENTIGTTGINVSDFFEEWTKQYEDLAGNWEKTFSDMANIGAQAMGDMFQQLGQDLVDGGIGFENYSAVAVQAISQVLVALSAQISALGVTHALTMDFAGAALAAAGAAAALAAAGALGAVAKNMKSTAEETSAVTAALEEFIKLLNELRSGKLTSSEFTASFMSLKKIVKETNDYLSKSIELFANTQTHLMNFYNNADRRNYEEMYRLGELEEYAEDVTDNLALAIIKYNLAVANNNMLLSETVANQKKEIASGKELSEMYEILYSDINRFYELLRNEQMIQIQGLKTSLLESMASLGADIGKMLTDGIKSGASKSDFAESLKELIREKMIEIAIYTEQFQNVLADAGAKLMSGIAGGDDSLIQQAKEQLESLYDTAVQTAEIVDKKLSSIFKSIKDTAKSATSSIAESMKSISESAVTSLRNLAGSQKQISSLLTTLKAQSKSWETVKSVSTSLLKSSANSAKTTLEAAKKNLETQQKALDNASKKLNDANAKLATAQQNLALSPYYGDTVVAIASRAYNQALLEQTAALKKYEEAEQKKNEAQQKSNSAQVAYNSAMSVYEAKLAEITPYLAQINEAQNKYNALIDETKSRLSNENVALKKQIEAYKELLTAQKDTVGFQNQLVGVRNQVLGIYDELSASALSLGESLVNAIANGMNKKDFSLELKDYIRQNIIKLNVYSGELGNRIATAGERLTAAIISQDSAGIKSAKSHMMTAYNEIDSLMKNIDKQLDDIFGVAEKTTTTVQKTEESVSSFQRAMDSFKDSITDLGSDVANNLISSLSNGLDADSALVGFKKFLREYIIKAYVFTESMKGEIEKIGKLIGKTLDGSVSKNELSNVANAVKATYGKLANSMKTVDTMLDSIFGKEAEKNVSSSANTVVENVSKIQKAIDNLKDSLKDLGGDFAEKLTGGLKKGLSKNDMLATMKDYIKDMVIQSVVYTDSMKLKIESIGKAIANLITGSKPKSMVTNVRNVIGSLYNELAKKSEDAFKVIDEVFPDMSKTVEQTAEQTEKSLSKLESAIDSFKETVSDLGGDVAGNFISSLNSGLDLDSALISLKKFIRNYVIQSAVYTNSLKSEMEKIGQGIADYIMGKNGGLDKISSEFKKIYNKLANNISKADEYLDKIFGKEKEEKIKDSSSTITKELSKIESAMKSFKETVSDLGGDIAGNFISSLQGGLNLESALISFKNFIRNYIVQATVYTNSMKTKLESIGSLISQMIDGTITKKKASTIKTEITATYEQLAASMKKVDSVLDEIFGKETEKEVEKTTTTIEKNLSRLEEAMDSFKETVSDLGGDIASNLIDGISNGLSQSDFLTNMKDWIKKMLVQSVVYTEQMKSEIEAIGKTISNAISGGFTETSMHEIRRDLSFIFEQASSKMSGIDKILGGVFDGYASGTTSALSGLHIVGECGPELVRFNGGERVYNNADTMKMIAGAGKTNNFNVTFNNLKDTSAFAMMSQLKQYNREMAINGVL